MEQDARELAKAENEGMGGGEESVLGRVSQALRAFDQPEGTSTNDTVATEPMREIARSYAIRPRQAHGLMQLPGD